MMKTQHEELVTVLHRAREYLARAENDFCYSGWTDSAAALQEIDKVMGQIASGNLPKRVDLSVLFAPTGPIQEVSLSSGWADDFLELANQFDRAMNRAYGCWR